ncbi:MAG: hypothetical protein FJZ01_10935 [Candidatus Sericytochromatia bacterium]|nr:hypothetical protein [Candidatus Tanganyikabacteria bacterium]
MGDSFQVSNGAKQAASAAKSAQGPAVPREAQPKIGTDSLKTHSEAVAAAAPRSVKDKDLEGINSLSSGVRQIVLTYGIQDGQVDEAKEKQIKQNLTDEIHKLVPGGIYLSNDKDAAWSIRDLTNLYNILHEMSPGDRQALGGVNFIRSHKAEAAEGASDAVRRQYGKDAAQLMEAMGAGGESSTTEETASSEGFFTRFARWVKGGFVHAIEGIEGFFNIRLLSDSTRSKYDGKPQRSVILTDTGSNLLVSNRIWAHEIGHQLQLSDGRWNPERIREFSKLSGWTETYESGKSEVFDGIDDRNGRILMFNEKIIKPTRKDNFVSKYAATAPGEDFAESYSSYLLNPGLLLQKAPEKFLFINAESKKYTQEQVRELATKAKIDLDGVATDLVGKADLKQETLTAIVTTHGLKPAPSAMMAAVTTQNMTPLMAAWADIVRAIQADPTKAAEAVQDPQALVRKENWDKLIDQDRWVFQNKGFMERTIKALTHGYGSVKSAADATRLQENRSATDKVLHLLLNDSVFRNELVANPVATLNKAGLGGALPSDVTKALIAEDNREALKALVKRVDALTKNELEWQRYQDNLAKLAGQMGPEHFTAFAEVLNDQKNTEQAAKVLENAIKTGNLIFPGDGSGQPGG